MQIEESPQPIWDIFICHASEDKDIARPLAHGLEKQGLRVWFDESILSLGKSLRREIDRGLSFSRHAVVIISPIFFKKEWPQKELDALVYREDQDLGVILPIWHGVSSDDLKRHFPTLADRIATRTDHGINHIITKILRAIGQDVKPDLTDQDSELSEGSLNVEYGRGDNKKPEKLHVFRSESKPVFLQKYSEMDYIKLDTTETQIYRFGDPILDPSCGALVVSPNNRRLACIAAKNDNLFLVVNGIKSEKFDRFADHTLCFSPNSKRLACGVFREGHCYLLVDNDRIDCDGHLQRITFSPDSLEFSYLLYRGNKWIAIQNGREGREYDSIGHSGLVYSADSRHLLYVGYLADKARLVLDGIEIASHDRIGDIVFNPDGDQIAYVAINDDLPSIVLDGNEIEKLDPEATGSLIFDERTQKPKLINTEEEGGYPVVLDDESLGRFKVKPTFHGIPADNISINHTFFSVPGHSVLSPLKRVGACAIPIGYGQIAIVVGGILGPAHDALQYCPPVFNPEENHIAYAAENYGLRSLFML